MDLRGALKNTKINRNCYSVIHELLTNAIDSYLIRKHSEPLLTGMDISFSICSLNSLLDNSPIDLEIVCEDNGAGLQEKQTKAFVTKDTTFKDDLQIYGVGQCKGVGRVQYFHYFQTVKIDSVFREKEGQPQRRRLEITVNTKEIDESSFQINEATTAEISTKVTLSSLKQEARPILESHGDAIETIFSASELKSQILTNFLQLLISLKEPLGNFRIRFVSELRGAREKAEITPQSLPKITLSKEIPIFYRNEQGDITDQETYIRLSLFKINPTDLALRTNTVALCARSSIVSDVTKRYLKVKAVRSNPIHDWYHIILIESPHLDNHLNINRDGFDIPDNYSALPWGATISMNDFYDSIDAEIHSMLDPPDWNRSDILEKLKVTFGISPSMVLESNVQIRYTDNERTVATRVLQWYQERIVDDTSEIFSLKEEIAQMNPKDSEYREKVNRLAWMYSSSLKKIDMANLSQLVVRRAAVLEILGHAISKGLLSQHQQVGKKRYDEEIIHSIFFPMQADSTTTTDHDIWILNEEWQYFSYIASDKQLSTYRWLDEPLFDSDIDEELQELLLKVNENHGRKRPDIAIFTNEGAAVIVEFKAPGVNLDEHLNDLYRYSVLLASKSSGKLKRFYGYLIGDTLEDSGMRGYTSFPSGRGFFSTEEIKEPKTNKRLGELYSEVLYYSDVLERANSRLSIYKERLNLPV